LITPFLVWIAVRMAEVTFRGHWLANSLLFVNLLILGACASPLPRDYSAEWRSLESLVVSKSDVFTAPHLSRLLQRSGRTVYDAGQTEYAFAASKHNFMPVAEEYRQRSQRFLQVVLLKMRNRQFDLIIINPGICPFLPIEELGRYYAPTSVLSAPMTFDSFIRPYPLTCWVPSKQSEEAPDRRKP
jgi:hypothetical protein